MRFFNHAGAAETLLNAFIVMAVTFAALIMLYLLMKVFALVFNLFKRKQPFAGNITGSLEDEPAKPQEGGAFSAGMLILKDVDEPTAAMIMAIVSDESGIPLERLIFRSIKLVKRGSRDDIQSNDQRQTV